MAEKKKSIIEEALLEAKTLEDALKANTKEMLSAHMSKEIESIVESSLREQDEETIELVDDIELKGSADDMDVELELDNEDDDSEESEELGMEVMDLPDDGEEVADIELDLDTDLDLDLDGGEELELDLEPMGMELGMDDVLDMTMSSDDEVVTVFKKLGPDDEVEVVKDADGIHLTDNETGAEYYIKESLEEMEMMDEDDEMCEGCGMDEDDEVMYEIEMDDELGEGHQSFSDRRSERRGMRKHYGENPDGLDAHLSHSKQGYNDRMDDSLGMDEDYGMDEEEVMDEDHTLARTKGYQRKGGHRNRQTSETRNSRKPVITRKPKTNTVAESKMLKEYNELKGKNTEYKKALNIFKDKLNEVALFNTNLAYVNRLFTENSTTKKEKMLILKRFDNADTIKESKSIYKTIKTELDAKTPISESVENKVNKTVKSSKSDLNESTAYVDPQISAIKDLMKRIS